MAVTYRWTFPTLECLPVQDRVTDVVTVVHWVRTAELNGATAEAYGTICLHRDQASPFIPFADLTAETVAGWVEAAIRPNRLVQQDAALAAALQSSVVAIAKPAPWAV